MFVITSLGTPARHSHCADPSATPRTPDARDARPAPTTSTEQPLPRPSGQGATR